jgi:hypothetical protein
MVQEYTVPSGVDLDPEVDLASSLGTPVRRFKNIYAQNISGNFSGNVVNTLNGLTGDVTLAPGANIGISTLGQTITISSTGGGSGTTSLFSFNELPSGTIDGVNSIYTVASAPINNSLELYWNGLYQLIPDDYVLTGTTITFVDPIASGSKLVANYEYSGSGTSYNFAFNEIPSGAINGSNPTFSTLGTPINNSLQLFANSIYMMNPDDYSLAGNIITFVFPPVSGSKIVCAYQY